MTDLGLNRVGSITTPTPSQAGYIVQVNDAGDNFVYRKGFEQPNVGERAVEPLPIISAVNLAVPMSDPQTVQFSLEIEESTVTELAYELTARDSSNNIYDRRGTWLIYRLGTGNVVDHSGLLDSYVTISMITGASADLVIGTTDISVRTTGGTASATKWQLRVWRAVTKTETP